MILNNAGCVEVKVLPATKLTPVAAVPSPVIWKLPWWLIEIVEVPAEVTTEPL